MITKHFFKILTVFAIMIILGLIGVFIVNSVGYANGQIFDVNNKVEVAK